MLKPKDLEIETTWEEEDGTLGETRLVYRKVNFTSEPMFWLKLHRKGQFSRTITFLAPPRFSRIVRGHQVFTWIR